MKEGERRKLDSGQGQREVEVERGLDRILTGLSNFPFPGCRTMNFCSLMPRRVMQMLQSCCVLKGFQL